MFVFCIEGCHGCGKTELCKQFDEAGYEVLDEAFIDMPEFSLHPQSLLMETLWITNWFKRLLEKQKKNPKGKIFIADRSPFSAVFYANENGNLLEPLIKQLIEDLKTSGIYIETVLIRVDKPILWRRITNRLTLEPGRKKFSEDKKEWMDKVVDFYEGKEWSFSVDNNLDGISTCYSKLDKIIREFIKSK